jgi:hypothetical protein
VNLSRSELLHDITLLTWSVFVFLGGCLLF